MNKFEKVSYAQFEKDFRGEFRSAEESVEDIYGKIQLPRRATKKSAGYDIKSPVSFVLNPNEEIKIPTGVKCSIDDGWFLMLVPRSGHGFKYYVRLANTLGVGDGDFHNNIGNEGDYWVKIRNEGKQSMRVLQGEAFCQAIFVPYGITVDDNPISNDRVGGLGSTD